MVVLRLFTLMLLWVVCCLPGEVGATPHVLTDERGSYEILPQIMAERQGPLSIHQVVAAQRDGQFRAVEGLGVDLGFQDQAWWFHLQLQDNSNGAHLWFLTLANSHLNDIQLYLPTKDGEWKHHTAGNRYPFHHRELSDPLFLFQMNLEPGKVQDVFFRIETSRFMRFRTFVTSPDRALTDTLTLRLGHGVFFGAILALIAYNLFVYYTTREKNYLGFIALMACVGLFEATVDGYSFWLLWPEATTWVNYDKYVIGSLGVVVSLQFTRTFLQTATHTPRLDKGLLGLMLTVVVITVAMVIGPFTRIVKIYHLLVLIGPPLSLVAGILCLLEGFRPARLFIAASGAAIAASIFVSFTSIGLVPGNWLFVPAMKVGALIRAVLLSFSLSDYINLIKAERSRAQILALENLKKAERLKDEFLANTSHELRTPLNGIIGIAESMQDGATGPLSASQSDNLALIVISARRLSNLVNDILDFSTLKEKGLVLKQQAVDVRSCVSLVVALLEPEARKKNLTLCTDIKMGLPAAWADENRLQQILYNLVGNAIKFTEHGEVRVTVSAEGGMLKVEVSDTGIGIPTDKLESIFQSFEQVDATTAREYGGTGLGLAITRQLVELHGGLIQASSQQGKGSNFSFTLPLSNLSAPVSELKKSSRPAPPPMSTPIAPRSVLQQAREDLGEIRARVLVVDDDPINLQVLVNQLTLERYAVEEATNGQDALDLVATHGKPDLILLDIMMPHMSGLEVCRRLRQKYPPNELPILFLTAKNQTGDLVEGLTIGANDYLTKPFSRQELLARLRNHLLLARLNTAYGRFVPHEFLRFLRHESIVDVRLGDQVQREMSIMFSDICAFTTLSEQMSPRENFNFLNAYLREMVPAIQQHHGVIDKYIGDAIMALFPGQAVDALQAALGMRRALRRFNEKRQRAGLPPVESGIGIHMGTLMLGIIGAEDRIQSTVISDAVNLASRLESLTRSYGSALIVSGALLEKIPPDLSLAYRYLGRVQVKGKTQAVPIYEVFEGENEELRRARLLTRSTFEAAVTAFDNERFAESRQGFESVLAQDPADTAARLYRERIDALSGNLPIQRHSLIS